MSTNQADQLHRERTVQIPTRSNASRDHHWQTRSMGVRVPEAVVLTDSEPDVVSSRRFRRAAVRGSASALAETRLPPQKQAVSTFGTTQLPTPFPAHDSEAVIRA